MGIELLLLGGYGQFVWPAFIFTFVGCFLLYLGTKRELESQEKKFLNEFRQMSVTKVESTKQKELLKKALLGNSI